MSSEQDQARLIAERVARRVAGTPGGASSARSPSPSPKTGGRFHEEISAFREGLHVLENKLERIESKIVQGVRQPSEPTRARVIDFVSTGPPLRSSPAIESPPQPSETRLPEQNFKIATQFVPATHSPWVRDFNVAAEHPSQERFGIEEATVS